MKVLLIEDNAALREMVAEHLAQRGFAVDPAQCGEDALAALAVSPYDAMILDLGLPDIDGMKLLATIRASAAGALPALILTARDSVEDRVRGLNGGADDYLVKPFALVELEARLRAVLRRPGSRRAPAYACGRLVFDTTSRQALADGKPIDLTRREAALLEELLRARGRVVVKDTLEDRLYMLDESVTSNALEALVSRLRKKLAASGAAVHVETKRGIGYRLAAGDGA